MSPVSTTARVESVTPLTDSIIQLILKPKQYVDYQAGQYLNILCGDNALSYSIANAPLGSKHYELHIRHSAENPYQKQLFSEIRQKGLLNIELPMGQCSIEQLSMQRPILFIAGGTGFAPIKAMIEHLLTNDMQEPFALYWGARTRSDLYMEEKVSHWQSHAAHFHYYSLLSDEKKDNLVSLVLKQQRQELSRWQIVVSGPFDMVYRTRDTFIQHGVLVESMYSDAFEFEKK
jgi:CDP-4-dehydro-6-deoxyglucose reductase, E3